MIVLNEGVVMSDTLTRKDCEGILKDHFDDNMFEVSGSNLDGDEIYLLDGFWTAKEILAIATWINAGWEVEG